MALLEQIGLGLYIGVLTGMFTALLIFTLGFVFQYVAGVAFPATMGLMIGLGAAGLQGGMFRLMRDPAMLQSPVIITALLVVMLITNYSQKRATDLAKAAPPKSAIFNRLRRKSLSPEVVKGLGRFGQVRVRPVGEVMDLEGYPPLPNDLRTAIRDDVWTFPADLPVPELEKRLAEQLMTEYDLEDVTVDIDEKAGATISAAPPSSGLSRRVPDGTQATTLQTIVPTGLAQGDEVRIEFDEETITGSVISVKPPEPKPDETKDGDAEKPKATGSTAAGGEGRVAVAVDRSDVPRTITADPTQFAARPRGQNREYELTSLLRKGGNAFRKVTVTRGDGLVEKSIAELDLRATHGVAVLALKRADTWLFAPDGTTRMQADDELFVTGSSRALDAIGGGVAQ